MLFLTPNAKSRIDKLLSENTDAKGILIEMKTAGCTGIMYEVKLLTDINPLKDRIIKVDEYTVGITEEYASSITGSTLDYVIDQFNSHFEIIDNPNEKAKCGCGESFSV